MEAGNSMVRQMQIVFPIVARIQSEVISRYGFPCNGPGSVQFIQVGRDDTRIFKKGWLMSDDNCFLLFPDYYVPK